MKITLQVYKGPLLILFCLLLQADGQDSVADPQNIRADAGQSVTLNCGKPALSNFFATWTVFPGNENLNAHERYKDRLKFTNNHLEVTIANLTKEDSGPYCCTVETINGTTKKQIILEVIQPSVSEGPKGHSCNMYSLNLGMEIFRIICLIALSILLAIAVKTSC